MQPALTQSQVLWFMFFLPPIASLLGLHTPQHTAPAITLWTISQTSCLVHRTPNSLEADWSLTHTFPSIRSQQSHSPA